MKYEQIIGGTVEDAEFKFPFLKNASFRNATINITERFLTWKDGLWEGGAWKDGLWEGGVWESGTWEGGAWEGGIWKYGIWEGGTWRSGIWKGGAWEGGIWKYGTWEGGTWEGGAWESGTWEGGIWKYGTWKYGTWEGGTWRSGTWEGGTWRSGTWEDGISSIIRCKWSILIVNKSIRIGCKTKTIDEWEDFFKSSEIYETDRDTPAFKEIYKAYKVAKYKIELDNQD